MNLNEIRPNYKLSFAVYNNAWHTVELPRDMLPATFIYHIAKSALTWVISQQKALNQTSQGTIYYNYTYYVDGSKEITPLNFKCMYSCTKSTETTDWTLNSWSIEIIENVI